MFGWMVWKEVHEYIETFDHWMASGLLFVISVRMIICAFSEDDKSGKLNPLRFRTMLSCWQLLQVLMLWPLGSVLAVIELNVFLSVMIIGQSLFLHL
jgi:manganese efflux pump family protein